MALGVFCKKELNFWLLLRKFGFFLAICQKKSRNGVHQEEENEVDLNLHGAKGIRGLIEEKGI